MGPFRKVITVTSSRDESIGLFPQPRRVESFDSAVYSNRRSAGYAPFVLRKVVGLGLVLTLVLLSGLVQVLNAVINYHYHGVGPVTSSTSGDSLTQYFWSAPTIAMVIISVSLSAAIGTMDFSLKRIEPYRQLANGAASADSSLLLEYLGVSQIFVWRRALENRHWIVFLSTLACLLSLVLSPLSSTLFTTKPALKVEHIPVTLTQSYGLPPEWDALIPSYSATNVVTSIFLSNGSFPAYVNSEWAVTAFKPGAAQQKGLSSNGTLDGTLPGIRSFANCEATDLDWSRNPQNDLEYDVKITGKQSGHSFVYSGFSSAGRTEFNASVMPLNGQTDPRLQSFIYRIYTPLTEDPGVGPPNMSVTICNPTVQAQQAVVTLDSETRALLSIKPLMGSPATNLSFLNGSAAFNGFYFDVSQYGPYVAQRKEATMFGLVSVMYQAALDYPGGLSQAYADNAHFNMTKNIYQKYLSLMSLKNYLNDTAPAKESPIKMTSTTLHNLLYVSTTSAIAISAVLLVLAVLVLTSLVLHWRTFGKIGLRVDPASMAGTGMTMVGGDVARLLSDPDTTQREMKATLRGYYWSLVDGKVCAVNGLGGMGKDI